MIQTVAANGGWVLEQAHNGTGWLLGKNHVSIEMIGQARPSEDGSYVADFRITVSRSDASFMSEVKDVACDEFGALHETSVTKFNEAVNKIKEMLDALQT